MSDIITTLKSKSNPTDSVYPNIIVDNIPDGAITTAKILDNSITSAKIQDEAITTSKIADDSITRDKIRAKQITYAEIDDETIGTGNIQDDAITHDKIADDSIDQYQLKDYCISKLKMAFNLFQVSMRVQFYDSGYDDTIDFELNFLISLSYEDDISDYYPTNMAELKTILSSLNPIINFNPLGLHFLYARWDGTNILLGYVDSNNAVQQVNDTDTTTYVNNVRDKKYF